MDYIELTVHLEPRNPWAEILVAQLADTGYESFVDTPDGIQAYGQLEQINLSNPIVGTFLDHDVTGCKASWSVNRIEQQNWNAVWEADFEPVYVENYLAILAPFHERKDGFQHTIEILPKMSFGTGHHQTTWMMVKGMFELPVMPASVLDMGTGTGILAILAEKLGAQNVLAIDIEPWSVENTIENASRNNCSRIEAICGDVDLVERKVDLILANINKNVLKAHLDSYANVLNNKGIVLLSGFFQTDVDEIISCANQVGLKKNRILNKENWAAVELVKT
jgi:ribosomal protein L11 methyltransferase